MSVVRWMEWIWKSEVVEAVDEVDFGDVCGVLVSKIRDDNCSREDASEKVT
jgi:hypothetical protein